MRIGFDATSLCRKITGIESYTLSLIQNLLRLDNENEYVVFFRKEIHPELLEFKNKAKFIICSVNNQIFCEQIWLPFIAFREKVDIVHFPAFPPGLLTRGKFIFTIHDAVIWKYPETLSWKGKFYFRPLTILGAKRALKIITVSDSAKNDISQYVLRKYDEIVNAKEGISCVFEKVFGSEMSEETRNRYNLPEKFILSVNSMEPRKNIRILLKAYKIFKERNKDTEYKLVLVGRRAWGKNEVLKEIQALHLTQDVVLTGYLPSGDLPLVYKLATIFVYPSLYEGFGLPPLEAMACGVPVVASNIPSLKEVSGDAAIFVDPDSPADIAGAIHDLIVDPSKRKVMISEGAVRKNIFSWDKVVERVTDIYSEFDIRRVRILGVDIDNVVVGDVLRVVNDLIRKKEKGYFLTPNVDHIIRLQSDVEFQKIYRDASLALPDGMPLLWAARFLRTPLKEKVSGSDLFPKLCEVAEKKGYKIFLLGGRAGAAKKAAEVLKIKHPDLQIAGLYSPPLGFESVDFENEKIITMILETKPDILFVGLGAPKQEKWIYKYKDRYQVPVSIGIGVSFEFVAGIVKRAPAWMQSAGLEWLWRLMMEPARLWKRYLLDDMRFFWLVLKQKFFEYPNKKIFKN